MRYVIGLRGIHQASREASDVAGRAVRTGGRLARYGLLYCYLLLLIFCWTRVLVVYICVFCILYPWTGVSVRGEMFPC